jgi:hypothetical protein
MIRSLRSYFGLLAFATLSMSVASGQESQLPVSRTAGVIDVSLPVNQTTLMAIPLVEIVASGTVTAVSGTTYTLSSSPTTLPNVLTTPHAIKITSRVDQRGTGANAPAGSSTNAYGLSAQITGQGGVSPNETVTAALATAPNVGDEFIIYQLETISSIFGAANSAGLNGSTGAAGADILYIDQAGALTGYFYKTGGLGGIGWKLVSAPTGSSQENTIIAPGRGCMVSRKNTGSTVTIRLSGDTVVGREAPAVVTGFNIMNYSFTLSSTLASSGITDFVTGSTGAAGADILYLESSGVLTGYFYKTGGLGGIGWKLVSAPTGSDQGAVVLQTGKAILFKEQAGTAGFAIPEPFAE